MKPKILTFIGALGLLLTVEEIKAQQIRQPLPTGQVPKVSTGTQGDASRAFQPKPTGQIAPEVPGHFGTIYQPAAPGTQRVSDVQSLGFESNLTPANQEGMVPKVNTTQDPATMPERYLPNQRQQPVVTEQQAMQAQEAISNWQQTQLPATGTNAAVGESTTTTQSVQTTTQPAPTGNGSITNTTQTGVRTQTQSQPATGQKAYQSTAPAAAPVRSAQP